MHRNTESLTAIPNLRILSYLLLGMAAIVIVSSLIQKAQGDKLPMTFGWGNALILTGSMEPTIPTRSLVVIHDTEDIEVGDIVTYMNETGSWPITHRVIKIYGDTITTQGDANNVADTPFSKQQLVGKVVLILPADSITKVFTGMMILAAVCSLALLLKNRKGIT